MPSFLKLSTCKVLVIKFLDYLWAISEYLLNPYGLLGTPEKRLNLKYETINSSSTLPLNERRHQICIFAAFQRRLDLSTRLYLEFLHSLGFSIYFVNNQTTSEADIDYLSGFVSRVYDRVNLGRDIGAIKDLFLRLREEALLVGCEYLMIVNDSTQFIPGKSAESLKAIIETQILLKRTGLFTHINYTHHTHYQSFFQILSQEIFNSAAFVRFWKTYHPISHRGHSIDKGEVRLTTKVFSKFSNLFTIYSTSRFSETAAALLKSCRSNDVHRLDLGRQRDILSFSPLRFLPPPASSIMRYKNWFYAKFFEVPLRPTTYAEIHLPHTVQSACCDAFASDNEIQHNAAYYASSELIELLESSNQTHVGAFLYPLLLGCPIIKKDISFMGTFPIGTAINNYKALLDLSMHEQSSDVVALKDKLVDEFEQLLTSKGTPSSYRRSRAKAIRLGLQKGFLYPYDPTSL